MSKYPKGSEWRKWDLHIHSNASDGNGTPEDIVRRAKERNLSVIAITDHHTFKNIDEVKRIGKEEGIVVISGIEFRTEYGNKSVHIIGLFPDEYKDQKLTQKALDDLILAKLNLSETHIIAKGRGLGNCTNDAAAFKKGIFEVQVAFKDASNLIREHGGIVTVHAGDKSNSIEDLKHSGKSARNTSIADSLGPLKSELLTKYVDFCEVSQSSDKKFYFDKFEKCSIVASDAHKSEEVGSKFTWIKGDPTFEGLRQASLEPDRIFIGDTPPSLERIRNSKTKTLEKLNVFWEESYKGTSGEWFNNIEIVFNSEMSVVIGNKGSGKTAIAEITALLSNSHNTDDFIFLHSNKFKKKKLASNFKAKLSWLDSVAENTKNLGENSDKNSEELVHFIPQRSFEVFCNDSDEAFVSEINKVVFSRMEEHERLGFKNFHDLISNQKSVIDKRKQTLFLSINELNNNIKQLESMRDRDYENSIHNSLKQLEIELEAHVKNKPAEIAQPEGSNKEEYKKLLDKLKKTEVEIEAEKQKLETLTKANATLSLIKDKLENLEITIRENIDGMKSELKLLAISAEDILKFNFDYSKITEEMEKYVFQIDEVNKRISVNPESIGSFISTQIELKRQIDECNKENEGNFSQYQKFLVASKEWEEKNKELQNRKMELIEKIDYLGDLKNSRLIEELNKVKSERLDMTEKIFTCIMEEVKIYNKYKVAIEEFIKKYRDKLDNYDIKIDTGIYPKDDFDKSFSETYMDNSVNGPFKGVDGAKKFTTYIRSGDFSTFNGIKEFLAAIQKEFDSDYSKCYHNMFKKNKYDEFFENLYGLQFLDSRYSLKLYGKSLNELSPGERGSLLIIFYLLLDARDIPLILDQPEDNLDNESVAKILVPFIKEAKKRRQIIMITHNANLAVVSDAEQVIRVKLDKQNRDKFSFVSGSLESKIIDDVVNVLEGTKDSFMIRNNKYNIQS